MVWTTTAQSAEGVVEMSSKADKLIYKAEMRSIWFSVDKIFKHFIIFKSKCVTFHRSVRVSKAFTHPLA